MHDTCRITASHDVGGSKRLGSSTMSLGDTKAIHVGLMFPVPE